MEIQNLTRELNRMEQELQEKYQDVGKFILEKAERESTEIAELVDRVVEMKRKLVKLKEEKLCTSCYQYNEADSIY